MVDYAQPRQVSYNVQWELTARCNSPGTILAGVPSALDAARPMLNGLLPFIASAEDAASDKTCIKAPLATDLIINDGSLPIV